MRTLLFVAAVRVSSTGTLAASDYRAEWLHFVVTPCAAATAVASDMAAAVGIGRTIDILRKRQRDNIERVFANVLPDLAGPPKDSRVRIYRRARIRSMDAVFETGPRELGRSR